MKSGQKGSIYEYIDYKNYLNDWIEGRAHGGRGERSQFASILRCHVAYMSRVLNGHAQLSLEQGQQLNEYLGHSDDESDFFLLLILYSRAGTKDLQTYYLGKIKKEVERKNILKNRLDHKKTLSAVDFPTFYSSWHYIAVHLLVTMPAFQNKESLARHLQLSKKKLNEILQFLIKEGLVIETSGRFHSGPTSIHLGNDSPMISKHHTNWRMQAIQSLDREKPDELHYSSVVTVGKKDIPAIRKIMVATIENIRAIVRASPEDSLYSYSFDLFEVGPNSN